MAWEKNDLIPQNEIKVAVTNESVEFAKRFGTHLGTDDRFINRRGESKSKGNKLTTNQLRKFFGEVKRQQLQGYNPTAFVLLKPKLAYAVGRAKSKEAKINDLYFVISRAIDEVQDESQFKNFIKIFEAIVAYHKAAEENIDII